MASSFDPLALVKAMGTQTDPYSWARQYGADSLKQQMQQELLAERFAERQEAVNQRGYDRQEARAQRAHEQEFRERNEKAKEAGRNARQQLRIDSARDNVSTNEINRLITEGHEVLSETQMRQASAMDPNAAKNFIPIPGGRQVYYVRKDANKPYAPNTRRSTNVPLPGADDYGYEDY